jgi:hypothetical protein
LGYSESRHSSEAAKNTLSEDNGLLDEAFIDRNPAEVVTAYRTSKVAKYGGTTDEGFV